MPDNLEEPLENEAETNEAISSGTDTSHSDRLDDAPFDQEIASVNVELDEELDSDDSAYLDNSSELPTTNQNAATRSPFNLADDDNTRISNFIHDYLGRYQENEVSFDFGDDGIEDAPFMQNRELSWLAFNERVLDQGADDTVPLLDRLNFISIFSSNLQEFFMVRVGSLTELATIDPPIRDSKTNMTAKQQLKAIYKRCRQLYPIQESVYEHVRGLLAQQGIRHLRPSDLTPEQSSYLKDVVENNIEPFLSPQIINSRHPFPHLENEKLYILVRLDRKDATERKKSKKQRDKEKLSKKDKGAEDVLLGLIPLPHQCERIIRIPGPGLSFVLLEHAIEMFASEIFSMYKIKHTNVVRVTRSADIDADDGSDELDDYREHMRRLLKQRDRLAPVRLECERQLSPVTEALMSKKLKLKRYQIFDTQVPLSMSFVRDLVEMIDEKKRNTLMYKPFTPAWPVCLDRSKPIIDQVAEHETLLFYPYESMDPFVMLLREAAQDPSVVSIKITLYRLAKQSHLAEALIAAAESGKEVTALFELRARFDENNNIEWSRRFERAGCTVLYGFKDLKAHAKICCITRRLPNGAIQHITQLGTGNYNEKTARLYTDLCYITTNEEFARDGIEFFRNMQLENISDNYNIISVAPLQIKHMILRELDRQIVLAQDGLPSGAFLKTNALTDKEIIEKIAEASRAGVSITLLVRGICCLIPGVPDQTEEVRVVSLIGRLLEHSRIYCFGQGEDSTVYLSSADLMTRNLDRRVEIAWPLLDSELKHRVLIYIGVCMHDTAKLRELRPDGTYTPLGAFTSLDKDNNPNPPYDSQAALIEEASLAATNAARESFQDSSRETDIPLSTSYDDSAIDDETYSYSLYDEPASADDLTRPYAKNEELTIDQIVDTTEELAHDTYGEEELIEIIQEEAFENDASVDEKPYDFSEEDIEPNDIEADYENEIITDDSLFSGEDSFDVYQENDLIEDEMHTEDLIEDDLPVDDFFEQDSVVNNYVLIEEDGFEETYETETQPAYTQPYQQEPLYSLPVSPSINPAQSGMISPYQSSIPYQTGHVPLYQTGAIPSYQPPVQPAPPIPYDVTAFAAYQTGTIPPYQTGAIPPYQTNTIPPYQTGQVAPYSAPSLQNLPFIQLASEIPAQPVSYAIPSGPGTGALYSAETVVPLIPADQIPSPQATQQVPTQEHELTSMSIDELMASVPEITPTSTGAQAHTQVVPEKRPMRIAVPAQQPVQQPGKTFTIPTKAEIRASNKAARAAEKAAKKAAKKAGGQQPTRASSDSVSKPKGKSVQKTATKPAPQQAAKPISHQSQQNAASSDFFAPQNQGIVMPPEKHGLFRKKDQ